MALKRATLDRPARALTAAAIRLDPKDRERARKETKKRPLPWQKTAFEFYDSLGEAHFAATWLGEACSRVSLQPAFAKSLGETPTPIDSDKSATEAGADLQEYAAVQATLARLGASEGGEAGILRACGVNLFVAGECNLIGRKDEENNDAERWEVISVEGLTTNTDGRYAIKPSPSSKRDEYITLNDDAFVLRIMRRHPRYSDWPDSAMRGALDYCEDLRVLTAAIRAAATSRISAGLLKVPENMTFGPRKVEDEEDGDEDPFLTKLIEHMTTPLMDPQSASAVVPILVRGNAEDLAALDVTELARGIDELAVKLREETRRSFATSIDLPAEILVGMGTANHWSAWAITDDAYRIHIEPYCIGIADALTFGYLRPGLEGSGTEALVAEPALWSIVTDPSGLVSSPNESLDVQDAYDRLEVSGSYYRQVRGIPESAAPDDAEMTRRKAIADIVGAWHKGAAGAASPGGDTSTGTAPNAVDQGPPPSAVTAAVKDAIVIEPVALEAGTDPFAGVGSHLARAEVALRTRVRFVADEALRRALERAGNRLRTVARDQDKSGLAYRIAKDTAPHLVASTLGEAMVAGLDTDVDDLLSHSWDALHLRWDEIVGQAQREARRYAVGLGIKAGVMAEGSLDALAAAGILDNGVFEQHAAELRTEGFAVLVDGLAALARERLYNPVAPVPEHGEYDGTTLVSPRLVRSALTTTGGGALTAAAVGTFGGVFTGSEMQDMLAVAAKAVFGKGFEWIYGDDGSRKQPFEPHVELDGRRFTSMGDERLSTSGTDGDWVGDFFWPDDHDGCQCEVARVVMRGSEEQLNTAISSDARMAMDTSALEDRLAASRRVDSMTLHGMAQWASERGFAQGGSLYDALAFNGLSDEEIAKVAQFLDGLTQDVPIVARELNGFGGEVLPYGVLGRTRSFAGPDRSVVTLTKSELTRSAAPGSVDTGYLMTVDPRATLTHELGHVAHNAVFNAADKASWVTRAEAFEDAAQRIALEVFGSEEEIARTLGAGALNPPREVFAEAFSALHSPPGVYPELSPERRAMVEEFARRMNFYVHEQGWTPERII